MITVARRRKLLSRCAPARSRSPSMSCARSSRESSASTSCPQPSSSSRNCRARRSASCRATNCARSSRRKPRRRKLRQARNQGFTKEDPMDLAFTKEEIAFREEVRQFFKDNVPPETRRKLVEGRHLSKDEMITWWRILNKKGWGVSHWPKEYGGTGWSSVQHYIFNEELQSYPAPAPLAFGVSMVGPVIYTFGNEKQKKEYLPRIANVDDWWCQGFSVPGSGSDLASLKTKAERKGDKWIINGQKTWTTLAQHADMIFCLCRTDPSAKKQTGISFIVFSMKSKGVTVRPIQTIDGGHEVNEVFFD